MSVRAKVRCEGIKDNAVSFSTVFDAANADTENARFTTATPWGNINLGINNPEALKQFESGKYWELYT